jgi:hypothetical protein
MDISLALKNEHSKAQTLKIVKYVGDDKKRFREVLDIFLNSEYRITQRAASPISIVATEHPEVVYPHLSKLIAKLNQPGEHPAIPRNILRIFQEIEIPEKFHGVLVDLCFKWIIEAQHPIAVRAFAITVAAKICTKYPELKNELKIILDELKKYPQQPAIRARIKSAARTLKLDK